MSPILTALIQAPLRSPSTFKHGRRCSPGGYRPGSCCPGATPKQWACTWPIGARVTPGKHGALLMDQAGWHISERLIVPPNITIVPLPAKCPELNSVENVWQFIRKQLALQPGVCVIHAIVDHCCDAWNRITEQPWHVMSIGLRHWAPGHVL